MSSSDGGKAPPSPLPTHQRVCIRDHWLIPSHPSPIRVQRSGTRQELLRGPLYYAAAHVAATLLCWRHSPAGVLGLAVLCGGDGLAEVVGRSIRTPRLPHNRNKSVGGSMACWLGGAATAWPLLAHYRQLGMFAAGMQGPQAALLQGAPLLYGVLLCSGVGALVESAPLHELDNVAVTASVALMARWYFGF